MLIKKQHIIISFLVIILLTTAGCSLFNQQQTNDNQKDKQQNQTQNYNDNQINKWNENFSEANLNDLAVGKKVSIMGTENTDGSVVANRIFIGDKETDFQNMNRIMRPADNNGDNHPLPNFKGERQNFEQFQNMSEEERMKMMEKMRTRRETSSAGRPSNIEKGITRLIGEIIGKDKSTITLKLENGGSKIVFFSESTDVKKFINNSMNGIKKGK